MIGNDEDEPSFTATDGWLGKFLKRNKFIVLVQTTIYSAIPSDWTEKAVCFYISFLEIRHQYVDSSIFSPMRRRFG